IAELESRTVTVKLPEVRITVAESRRRNMTWRELGAYNEGADVAAERIGKELTAQGIKWEAE
ncbi:TPA: ead/Ea22-like family protein, partial [Klebsiella aerogenes]